MSEYLGTATYSPDDNKLRLYPFARLSREDYERVKKAGFGWAPRQELFVAPMWTPGREDLLLEICGEIGDEDTSLSDRAEDRAERFEDYSEKRAGDAAAAHKAVSAIADNIPLGQPILIGHHSERHARKDAQRIENGMRKAVKMWETSQYWQSRAAGAIRHAKYKELPAVRARRIKTIEADKRRYERSKSHCEQYRTLWSEEGLTLARATQLANFDHISKCFTLAEYPREASASQYEGSMSLWSALDGGIITEEQARAIAVRSHTRVLERCGRWLAHIENRLTYERAMLGEAGGTVADRNAPQKGGGVKCWASHRGGWSYVQKVNKVSVTVLDNWGNGGANFTRTIPFDKLSGVMSAAEVQEVRDSGRLVETSDQTGFFLREKPTDEAKEESAAERKDRQHKEYVAAREPEPAEAAAFQAMRETLRHGVKVVTAPQLFPTPADLAARMVDMAEIQPGHSVLEPSAGTGAILAALPNLRPSGYVVAVELNQSLADNLREVADETRCADFLQCNGDLGTFDRIVMNPPFANGSDILHIQHAAHMLKPGGRLVAICANGPRQNEKLRPLCSEWHDLPAGTFKEAGTGVNTALIVIEA